MAGVTGPPAIGRATRPKPAQISDRFQALLSKLEGDDAAVHGKWGDDEPGNSFTKGQYGYVSLYNNLHDNLKSKSRSERKTTRDTVGRRPQASGAWPTPDTEFHSRSADPRISRSAHGGSPGGQEGVIVEIAA